MKNYLDLLKEIIECGEEKTNRTGVNTLTLFGKSLKFNLNDGFPIITTRKIFWKNVIYELLWFIKGDTNIKYLNTNNVNIWNNWADKNGNLGPIYGKQLRAWNKNIFYKIDQLKNVINSIKKNPNSRRHIITLWNPSDIEKMALPPCHGNHIQFFVSHNKYLNCHMLQRSCDTVCGLPYNISEYALLLTMISKLTNYIPNELMITIVDAHIYINHLEPLKIQFERVYKQLPKLDINMNNIENIDDFNDKSFKLINYNFDPHIKFNIAI